MLCPYCEVPTTKTVQQCPHCGFSVPGLDKIYGETRILDMPIADLAGVLGIGERRMILKAIDRIEQRFPQCRALVATSRIRTAYPVSLFAIWAINRAELYEERKQGADNHDILVAIDPYMRSAALTLGYELEAFIRSRQLGNAVAAGQMELESGRFGEAVPQIFDALTDELASVARTNGKTAIVS